MTDNELLLAISNIVQSYTNPIQQQILDTEARLENKIETVQTYLEGRICSVETKLENRIDSVEAKLEQRIDSVETKLEQRIDSVEAKLEQRIDSVEKELGSRIDSVHAELSNRIDSLETRFESKFHSLNDELRQTRSEVKQIQILLENDVLPRLQTIESCYVSTYQRYADNVIQIETLQSDVSILKDVVAEHSETLKKIS